MPTAGPQRTKTASLAELAGRQHGYFTAGQAKSLGYAQNHHPYHLNNGDWLKIDRGLFRWPGFADCLEADFVRWTLWSRNQKDQPQAVISHESALAAHGLTRAESGEIKPLDREPVCRPVHLSVPRDFRKAPPAEVELHRCSLLLSGVEVRSGYLLTTLAQTLADLGEPAAGRIEPAPIQPPAAGAEPLPAPPEPAADAIDENQLMRERVFQMIYNRTRKALLSGQSPEARRRTQSGFTLVELLVVMAIITLLAGMLLPALKQGLEFSRGVACQNNQRQIGLASTQYTEESGDWLVAYYTGSPCYLWYNLLGKMYLTGLVPSGEGLRPQGLWACPMSKLVIGPGGGACATDYGKNAFTGKSATDTGSQAPHKLSIFKQHSRIMFGADQKNWSNFSLTGGGLYNYIGVDPSLLPFCPGGTDPRHNGRTNLVYLDNHVKAIDPHDPAELYIGGAARYPWCDDGQTF